MQIHEEMHRMEELHEEVEHLEHLPPSAARLITTTALVLVIATTAVAAILAAFAASTDAVASRNRQQYEASAISDRSNATQRVASATQQLDAGLELRWRALLLRQLAGEATDPDTRLRLVAEANAADAQATATVSSAPTQRDGLTAYAAGQRLPVTVDEQMAESYGQKAVGWVAKEESYVSTISILAVGLFLLGLALTAPHRLTALGFTGLALVALLISVGRLIFVAAPSVTVPSGPAIAAYARGQMDLELGNAKDAADSFRQAIRSSPGYAAAWQGLGDAAFSLAEDPSVTSGSSDTFRAAFRGVAADYLKAISLGHPSATLDNNVGFAQTLAGDRSAALRNLNEANRLDPGNEVTLASLAEAEVAAGNPEKASTYLNQAMSSVATHGPRFQNPYFANIRSDQSAMASVGVPDASLQPFFTDVRNSEARMALCDAQHQWPGCGSSAHGATVTNLQIRPLTGVVGDHGGTTVSFSYAGLQTYDQLALRWYTGGSLDAAASDVLPVSSDPGSLLTPGSGSFDPFKESVPLSPGQSYTVEVYLNGAQLASLDFTAGGTPVG